MNAISEVLNLNFDSEEWSMILGSGRGGSANSQEEGTVIHAALLPSPSDTRTDLFIAERPLLGILCVLFFSLYFSFVLIFPRMQMTPTEDDYDEECESSLVLYSLRNHHLVKRLSLSGPASTFTANDQFTVVVSHPIRLATNLLICIRRAWVHRLLYSSFRLQDSRPCILYHHCH